MTKREKFLKSYSDSMRRFGFDFSRPQFNIVTTLTVIAIAAIVVSAVIGVISAFTPPKPSKISFGGVGGNEGPRYGGFGALDNTISNDLAVPVLYGKLKLAGNVIWQTDPGDTVSRIIGVGEGLIQGVTDVRANDNVIDDTNTPGSNYTIYLGSSTQGADTRVPENLRPDLEFHNFAYLALTLTVSEKIKGGNPTITYIAHGLLVEIWDGTRWGPDKVYSRNPAACIRDFIINSRYGLGFSAANLDDATFGESYEFCEEPVASSAAVSAGTGTVLLLHMDGPSGSTVFLDSSSTPKTVTPNGNTQVSDLQFKAGNGSALFDGNEDYLTIPDHNDFHFGTKDFTIRFWTYFNQVAIDQTIFEISGIVSFFATTSQLWVVRINGINVITLNPFFASANTWYFWEITRSGSTFTLFRDGQVVGTGTSSADLSSSPSGIYIGYGLNDLADYMNGYLDEFEILKGVAMHTSSFDTPDDSQARFRLDYVIDNQRPAQDVLNEMLATFGGFLVYSGSKIKLKCEKIEPITQYFGDGSTTAQNATFDPNNIVKDSMSWNFPSVDDRPNRVRIQWVDPDQNYVKVYTQVDDRIDQDDRNIVIVKDISLLGITRASQASRMAKLYMAKTKYASASVQFSARLESIHCEIGDVVAVTHQASMWVRKLMRITDMQEAEDETIRLVLTEYNESIYDDRQAAAITVQQQPSGPNLYAPLDDVTNLSAREDNFKNKDGVFVVNILVSWTPIAGDQLMRLDHYLIQILEDGGVSYRDASFASPQKSNVRIVLGNVETLTNFVVKVKTVSVRGAESVGATVELEVSGKVTPPANVEDFDVSFKDDHVEIDWSAVDDADLYGYEIRSGNENAVWETAAIVTTENAGTHYNHFAITRGTKKYFIKAIDNSGNYSEVAAVDLITISDIPNSNVVVNFDAWSRVTIPPAKYPLFGMISGSRYMGPASSIKMNGKTQVIRVLQHPDFTLGTKDFCFEIYAFIRNDIPTNDGKGLFSMGRGTNSFLIEIEKQFTGLLQLQMTWVIAGVPAGTFISPGFTFNQNTWYHFAISRQVNTFRMFIDGIIVRQFDATADYPYFFSEVIPTQTRYLDIGWDGVGALGTRYWKGNLQEARITIGSPRYTENFTRPTAPFEPDSNTFLLLHMDEGAGPFVKDSSGKNHNAFINTDPDWTGGFVRNKIPGLSQIPAADYNNNYRRIALQTCTEKAFFDYQDQAFTYQSLQESEFIFGEENFITTEESWETEPVDLGTVISANYILEILSSSTTNLGFVTAQIATSTDGVTYSGYTQFASGLYTARFVKFKFKLQSLEARAIAKLISAFLTVDATDREQNFLNQAISGSGTVINLTGFASVKSIVITTVGTSDLRARIQDQSNLPNSFEVRMVDGAGNLQPGNVNINVKGY